MRSVTEMRGLELVVFEVLTLPVDVVETEEVLEDEGDLDAVDDEVVVLEVVAVPVFVGVFNVLVVPFGLGDSLDEPVDVLDTVIDFV